MRRPRATTTLLRTALTSLSAACVLSVGIPVARGSTTPRPSLAQLVDTRAATAGAGHTFPGAMVPFGMVQWSPDTAPTYPDGGGYAFTDTVLRGFSLTHLSGPGCPAAGDVPMLPFTGPVPAGDPNQISTPFSHIGEVAQAGYYAVRSDQPSTITSEFTATPHSAMARFTYPATPQADFLIKLMGGQNGDLAPTVQVVGSQEVLGSVTSGDFCHEATNAGQPQTYTLYFDIVFDRPFASASVLRNPGQSTPAAVALSFDTTHDRVVRAKVGISYVSAADAALNWRTENPGWNFDAVRERAQASWNGLLGRIQVRGGSPAQTQEFYSLLYKSMLEPSVISDVNGAFLGADLKVDALAPGQHNQYGMFSGWDMYHSLAQLQAMLDPQAAGDMAQSQLNFYAEDRVLQQWGYDNLNNYVMVGDPADAIIADEYAFGARQFDTRQALSDMLAQANTVNPVRPGAALEQQLGYLPEDGVYGCCHAHGFVSALLEYDTADLALAQFAQSLGDQGDAAMLTARANNWENLFDPQTGLLTARLANGLFEPGVTPTVSPGFPTDHEPYVEGSPYEYLWDVPNDYAALFSLLGGPSTVRGLLSRYLSRPNAGGMYARITNEFDLGEQFALDYAQDPAATQQIVARIRNTLERPGPFALNNDDLGANAATFVWEMLGLYPENPGHGTLVFASPGFPEATVHLGDGRTLRIEAPGASPTRYYVDSLRVNGRPYNRPWIGYAELARGATLSWDLGTAATSWGSAPSAAPPSYGSGLRPVVGVLSPQQVTLAPSAAAPVVLEARNATASAQRVTVSLSTPIGSGLTLSQTSGTLLVAPNGGARLPLTVRVSPTAPAGLDWITAQLSEPGGAIETVPLAVTVGPPPG
ncbi:MAG TPA: GH92 family glycosyl hydrolase [Solirubrobacteraceae bacterium]|nr:GH92 family glycosyl hydrolase [Solirubrobacteraceae bacterium]